MGLQPSAMQTSSSEADPVAERQQLEMIENDEKTIVGDKPTIQDPSDSTDSETDSSSSTEETTNRPPQVHSRQQLKQSSTVKMVPSLPKNSAALGRSRSLQPRSTQFDSAPPPPPPSTQQPIAFDEQSDVTPLASNCRKRCVKFSEDEEEDEALVPGRRSRSKPLPHSRPGSRENASSHRPASSHGHLSEAVVDDENVNELRAEWVAMRRRILGLDRHDNRETTPALPSRSRSVQVLPVHRSRSLQVKSRSQSTEEAPDRSKAERRIIPLNMERTRDQRKH